MPIKVTCPKCQGVLHAPDDAGGKRGKCPTCGTVLAIPADGGSDQDGDVAPSTPSVADVEVRALRRDAPDGQRRAGLGALGFGALIVVSLALSAPSATLVAVAALAPHAATPPSTEART